MQKAHCVSFSKFLTDDMEALNRYLSEGWKVSTISALPSGSNPYGSWLVILEKD